MPLYPAAGSALANSRNRPDSAALVIHSLRPVSRKWSPAIHGARGQGEGVRSRAGLGQRVGRHRVGRQARQIFVLLRRVGPAQNGVVDDGVLHVDDDAGRRIHRGQFLHRQNALEETAAAAAVFFGDLDAHQAQFEELADDVLAEHAGLVHFADVRADLLARELAHGGLKELLFFRQRGERLWRNLGLLRAGWHGFISLYYTAPVRGHCAALRFGHPGVRHVAVVGVDAFAQSGCSVQARSRPLFASSSR